MAAADLTEQDRADFRRAVAQRCLFGVDINPMAVQLARLSMWLATLAADKPLDVPRSSAARRPQPDRRVASGCRPPAVSRPGAAAARDLPLFPADEFATSMESAIGVRRQIAEGPGRQPGPGACERNGRSPRSKAKTAPWRRWRDGRRPVVRRLAGRGGRRAIGARSARCWTTCCSAPALCRPAPSTPAHARQGCVARRAGVQLGDGVPGGVLRGRRRRDDSSGFDVVLGNPPWDVLHETEGRESERRLTAYARGSGQYGLQGAGHANLYQLFFERGLRLLKPGGRCALILPSGFATDQGSGAAAAPPARTDRGRHLHDHRQPRRHLPHPSIAEVPAADVHQPRRRPGLCRCAAGCGRPSRSTASRTAASTRRRCRCRKVDGRAGERRGLELPDVRTALDLEILSRITVRVPAAGGPCRMAHPLRPGAECDGRPAALHRTRQSANC